MTNLHRKVRIAVADEHAHRELWHIFISPLKLLGVAVGALVVFFIIVMFLAAYTPLLNLVPGYSGSKQREEMIRGILRVDSIEQRMADIEAWSYDVGLIMEGRTPVVHDIITSKIDSARIERPATVLPSTLDSVLREQMEGDGVYGLNTGGATQQAAMQAPVRGVVAQKFDTREGMFGVRVSTSLEQQVVAVSEGTVVMSNWAVGAGHTVEVQHANNMISIYRHLSQSLVAPGRRVKAGEVLGSVEQGNAVLEFELWQNGNPVNPENYVVF